MIEMTEMLLRRFSKIWVRLFLLGDIIIIEQSFSRIQKSLAQVFWRDIRELMA